MPTIYRDARIPHGRCQWISALLAAHLKTANKISAAAFRAGTRKVPFFLGQFHVPVMHLDNLLVVPYPITVIQVRGYDVEAPWLMPVARLHPEAFVLRMMQHRETAIAHDDSTLAILRPTCDGTTTDRLHCPLRKNVRRAAERGIACQIDGIPEHVSDAIVLFPRLLFQ